MKNETGKTFEVAPWDGKGDKPEIFDQVEKYCSATQERVEIIQRIIEYGMFRESERYLAQRDHENDRFKMVEPYFLEGVEVEPNQMGARALFLFYDRESGEYVCIAKRRAKGDTHPDTFEIPGGRVIPISFWDRGDFSAREYIEFEPPLSCLVREVLEESDSGLIAHSTHAIGSFTTFVQRPDKPRYIETVIPYLLQPDDFYLMLARMSQKGWRQYRTNDLSEGQTFPSVESVLAVLNGVSSPGVEFSTNNHICITQFNPSRRPFLIGDPSINLSHSLITTRHFWDTYGIKVADYFTYMVHFMDWQNKRARAVGNG